MKIINPVDGSEFDAPTAAEWEKKYFPFVRGDMFVSCRCGWSGGRYELTHEVDIEYMHPKNRYNRYCNMQDTSGCHLTAFEKCPRCKRVVFSDDQIIQ